jgi:hypothetical protein
MHYSAGIGPDHELGLRTKVCTLSALAESHSLWLTVEEKEVNDAPSLLLHGLHFLLSPCSS